MNGFLLAIGQFYWLPLPLAASLWAWCHWIGYPLYLEARIRGGKGWVYLPRWWRAGTKTAVTAGTNLVFLLNVVALCAAVYHFFPYGRIFAALVLVAASILFFFLQRHWIAVRFIQQREGYFLIYQRIAHRYHESGKAFNDIEIRNRCMYEHQNTLRRADQRGRLLRYLDLLGKIQRKSAPQADFVA